MAIDQFTQSTHPLDSASARRLIDTDVVQAHSREAVSWVAAEIAEQFSHQLLMDLTVYPGQVYRPNLESPAEAVFQVWWRACRLVRQIDFVLWRQVPVNGRSGAEYRADFQCVHSPTVRPIVETPLPVLVEIDGHQFHERTREQVERRNKRDRDLDSAGYKVVHFSFSELTRTPIACVETVEQAAWRAYSEMLSRIREECAEPPPEP